MTQADAEDRLVAVHQLADFRHRIGAGGGRIAGPVRQQDAVRIARQHVLGAGRGRQDGGPRADAGERAQDVALHAIVEDHDIVLRLRQRLGVALGPVPQALVIDEGLQAGGVLGEVQADEAGPAPGLGDQVFEVEAALGVVGDDAVRHALLADAAGERPGVDPRQSDDAAPRHPGLQVGVGTPVGRGGRHVAEDGAAGGGFGRAGHLLDVLNIGPDIAHVREGEGHDLGHVRGVRQDLLITRHGGVEADLAHRVAGRADADPLKDVMGDSFAGGLWSQKGGRG